MRTDSRPTYVTTKPIAVSGWESHCGCRQRRREVKVTATEPSCSATSKKAQKDYEETMNDAAIYGLRPPGSPTAWLYERR